MTIAASAEDLRASRAKWKLRQSDQADLTGLAIGIASTFTSEPIAPYFASQLIDSGLGCRTVHFAPYNQIVQSCMNPLAAFNDKVDVALVLWRIEDIAPSALHDLVGGRHDRVQDVVNAASGVAQAAAEMQRVTGIPTLLAIPPLPYAPGLDSTSLAFGPALVGCHTAVVRCVEEAINANGLLRFDFNTLINHFGLERAIDWRKWYLYRQPYTEQFWWRIAERATRLLEASRSARKKCLVLDCDNTIWGGVVGEDGIEGIALGDDFPGSAFRDFQRQAAILAAGGVFVALASKNNPADVWRVFDEHDGMALSRDQISVAQIGWTEKADGIAEIARQLNIGIDSIVFVDDSPIEIEKVRSRMPEVTCLLAPADPAELPLLLLNNKYFDQLRVTDEDRARGHSFRAEKNREEMRVATSPEEFRQSLQLTLKIGPVRPAHVGRVAQLINKTNQFNLTTRRRSETEVSALLVEHETTVLALDLEDRFGSYGIVGVAVLKTIGKTWELDSFLLSCRALGRGVEHAFKAAIAEIARERGIERIRASFLPTAKNAVAAGFLGEVGFSKISEEAFEAEIDGIRGLDPYVTVIPL